MVAKLKTRENNPRQYRYTGQAGVGRVESLHCILLMHGSVVVIVPFSTEADSSATCGTIAGPQGGHRPVYRPARLPVWEPRGGRAETRRW